MITTIVLDPADQLGSLELVAAIATRLVARRRRALTWVRAVDVEVPARCGQPLVVRVP